MKRSARDFYEQAATAQKRALQATDLYTRLVWLDIAQMWCELAEFALSAECERQKHNLH